MAEDLVLDTAIRDWVLVPLSVVMVLIGILRYFVGKLMRSFQTPDEESQGRVRSPIGQKSHIKSPVLRICGSPVCGLIKIFLDGRQLILRARNLRAAGGFIPGKSFRSRRFYYTNEENGLLFVPKGQAQNPQAQMFSDPNMAMDMMKKNLSMIIPQSLTFAWVNFFSLWFCGSKNTLPIDSKVQINAAKWDRLEHRRSMDDTQRMMQMSGFGVDPTQNLSAEKDGLDIIQHEWILPKMEQRAAEVLQKLVK
ncbi:hypothetical protein HPP92_000415 [Vanilla planifolia]|uniref:ER membrane protein complex subunit 3 n=1 Tax=Vanilla planifolia TaxID=51239 RepID=A0A835RPW3_VANPL|nr:hypothetical protein HPP92_000415 [Vanilla planifolia]